MAGCALLSRLSLLVRGHVSSRRLAARALSGSLTCPQQHEAEVGGVLPGKVDRFGGVTVDLAEAGLPVDISESSFSKLLEGAVVDESNGKVLVVQDKNKTKNAWKFPGGLSDPGEDIGATAVREVFEETGVRSEFRALLSVRQQHDLPGAFGMSDMYLICRLSPLSYDIHFCTQECLRCEWLDLGELARTGETTPITSRVARLLLRGLQDGFQQVDLPMETLPAVHPGRVYQLYHRPMPCQPGV